MSAARTYVYLVARIDFFDDEELVLRRDLSTWHTENQATYGPLPSAGRISGTKAFSSIEEARAHAERLNLENAEKGSRYFVLLGRLDGSSA